jgi:hypothetical protein
MCHDRQTPQIGNVRREHENARTAYYADGKGDDHFPMQSHLYRPYSPTWRHTHCDGPSILLILDLVLAVRSR